MWRGVVDWFRKNQNNDFGWGVCKGDESDVAHTGYALVALNQLCNYGQSEPLIRKMMNDGFTWLLNQQNEDRGFGCFKGNKSNMFHLSFAIDSCDIALMSSATDSCPLFMRAWAANLLGDVGCVVTVYLLFPS